MKKITATIRRSRRREAGFSLIEMVIVVAIIGIAAAMVLPQLIGSRRQLRFANIPREITTQLRSARQLAMSNQQAVTFQYDNTNKQIVIISHQLANGTKLSGLAALTDANYPNNGVKSSPTSLIGFGVKAADLSYGKPPGASANALSDGTTMTPVVNSVVNITFQPDGSVLKATGNPAVLSTDDRALFIYNAQYPDSTASAVSVLGSAGRVKLWRYNSNAATYAE